MKRTFTIITVLITLSLLGIIFIQISWLKNMILLKEEQIKGKVERAVMMVGDELAQYKGNYLSSKISSPNAIFHDDFTMEFLRPVTIGRRFTAAELREKIEKAFHTMELDKVRFEFMLATISPRTQGVEKIELQSRNFAVEYDDTLNNYSRGFPLFAPSGSAAENLALDETLVVVALDWRDAALKELRVRILSSILFTIIIITAFYLTVRTMLRQKKLGEIKNDFINNMTHEFKTPIATISLAVDALKNEKVMQDREKMGYFSAIIKEENQRMNRQVETILKASQLDKQEVELNMQPLHAHEVIRDVVGNFALQLQEKNGKAELTLNAESDLVMADEVHFTNMINNLIDNAVKYSRETVPLQVKISTQSNGKSLVIKVEDNGIGMNKETVKRVFEKFYRAHTGNLHNVKGFGLGLSYVKSVVEAQGGEIKVDSVLGKGSSFVLNFPLKKT